MQQFLNRTDWAERYVEEFLAQPFISEFVFRSLQKFDPTQKEVADFLLMLGDSGILVSQKAQDDPLRRTPEKNELWVRKNAKDAFSQLAGALRSANKKPIWCQHVRRGRVEFPSGLPRILHAIVLVETRVAVDLRPCADELPSVYSGVPITYLSLNDFLNLVRELRTIPDLLAYLGARRVLPLDCLHVVGEEKPVFEYCILNGGTLTGCIGHADAKIVIAAKQRELRSKLEQRAEQVFCNEYLEYVADCLATRNADYAVGLSPGQLAAFDGPAERKNYIAMQTVVTELTLGERAELGRALLTVGAKLEDEMEGFVYRAAHFTSRDWVFILCSSTNVPRPEVLRRVEYLLRGALAFYRKSNCMVIIDRDEESYEVAKSKTSYCTTIADNALGDVYFAKLRSASRLLNSV
jgi:hypothetical protein